MEREAPEFKDCQPLNAEREAPDAAEKTPVERQSNRLTPCRCCRRAKREREAPPAVSQGGRCSVGCSNQCWPTSHQRSPRLLTARLNAGSTKLHSALKCTPRPGSQTIQASPKRPQVQLRNSIWLVGGGGEMTSPQQASLQGTGTKSTEEQGPQ